MSDGTLLNWIIAMAVVIVIGLILFGIFGSSESDTPDEEPSEKREGVTLQSMRDGIKAFVVPNELVHDPTYQTLLADFGRAICKEKRATIEEADRLPAETVFYSEKVKTAYDNLRGWLRANAHDENYASRRVLDILGGRYF